MDRGDWRATIFLWVRHDWAHINTYTLPTHTHTETNFTLNWERWHFLYSPCYFYWWSSSSVLFLKKNTILSPLVGPHCPLSVPQLEVSPAGAWSLGKTILSDGKILFQWKQGRHLNTLWVNVEFKYSNSYSKRRYLQNPTADVTGNFWSALIFVIMCQVFSLFMFLLFALIQNKVKWLEEEECNSQFYL